MIKENLIIVKKSIEAICKKCGRNVNEITLLNVSKTYPLENIMECYKEGERNFGENYVQELIDKIENGPKDIKWHMIGHLQTNKIKYIIDKIFLIHSIDSEHLAIAIDKEAEKRNISTVNILIEVNIANENTKFGNGKEKTIELIKNISSLPHINIKGLMTSAPYTENAEDNRIYFREMKNLLTEINNMKIPNVNMTELSMGMSGDYLVAIEEGATIVRVGTAIFGKRWYAK